MKPLENMLIEFLEKMSMNAYDGIIKYRPPRLTRSDYGWYISFYVLDPTTNKLKLQRLKGGLNFIPDKKDREKQAKRIISELNKKLALGWNPLFKKHGRNAGHTITQACENFLKVKSKELKSESIRSYKSYCDQLLTYLKKIKRDKDNVLDIRQHDIEDWINKEYDSGQISSNTFNNKARFFFLFGAWLQENAYSKINPFASIPKKKKQPKTRQIFTEEELEKTFTYLKAHNPVLGLFMRLVYLGLLRPQEITRLRVSHIHIENNTILLTPDITKNSKHRTCTLNTDIMSEIRQHITDKPSNFYVMGRKYACSSEKMNSRDPAKDFDAIRPVLGLSIHKKIYSLRDNGIIFYLNNGVPPQEIIKQAGHKDLSILSK